jgi:hypothetical protein
MNIAFPSAYKNREEKRSEKTFLVGKLSMMVLIYGQNLKATVAERQAFACY